MALLAGLVAIIVARTFGRGPDTDGFFAAYGVFTTLMVAATAFRVVVQPALARAQEAGRLGAETLAYALALAALAVPALAVAVFASSWLGALLTGNLPEVAATTAAASLVWMIPAAVAHLYAGLAASALAALDSYGVAALGYTAGSVGGLTLIVLRVEIDGIVVVAWGVALNGAIALAAPLTALVLHRGLGQLSISASRIRAQLGTFVHGVTLPLAIQGLFLISLGFASALGVGAQTSLSYAYVTASAVVTVTASTLGLVSTVPLTRHGLGGGRARRHVLSTTLLSLVWIALATGALALAAEPVFDSILGDAYSGEVGSELGELVVYLSPWMVANAAISVTYPLLFVAGRTRALPLLAVFVLVVHVPVQWAARELLGLAGLAAGLAVTATLVLAALLALLSTRTLALVTRDFAVPALVTAGLAMLAFGAAIAVLSGALAALAGAALYLALLASLRPHGLREAWTYVRNL